MSEKTTVTKAPVTESGDPRPGAGENQDKELENRIRENLRAEYNRSEKELSTKLSERDEKIAELEGRLNDLTAAEERKLGNLKDERAELEKQLNILETDPSYRPYVEKINREVSKVEDRAVEKAMFQTSLSQAERFIAKEAAREGISADQLRKEVNAILKGGRWGDMLPFERAEFAIEERASQKETEALREENKQLKAEKEAFSESGQRKPREQSVTELRESHISGDEEAGIARSKALGL